jgi:ribosomal-protein-alanine N-acetyltransferase
MLLSTSRLFLREFTTEDLEDLHEVLGDPLVMKFSLSGPCSREKTATFIQGCIDAYSLRKAGLLAVVSRENEKVIGYCGFFYLQIDDLDEIELSYRLNSAYWNRGLATEAASAIKNHTFEKLGFSRLIACIEPANHGSIRVAEKIGMHHEKNALFRDQIPVRVYSVENR